ncbi:hypothetical protein ACP70R_009997 [Stipagrostis hirtigluma subsp. patula]
MEWYVEQRVLYPVKKTEHDQELEGVMSGQRFASLRRCDFQDGDVVCKACKNHMAEVMVNGAEKMSHKSGEEVSTDDLVLM